MTVTTAFQEPGSANGPRRGNALTITGLILMGALAIATPAAAQDVGSPAAAVSTGVAPAEGVDLNYVVTVLTVGRSQQVEVGERLRRCHGANLSGIGLRGMPSGRSAGDEAVPGVCRDDRSL
jgi:hypothetical protein